MNFNDYFVLSARPGRVNPWRISKQFCAHDFRIMFFTIEIIDHWNNLREEEVNVNSISQFKASVSSYFDRMDIW